MKSGSNKTDSLVGFKPVVDKQAKLLILGSMPSVKSLEYQEYYGHPNNAFWFIMGALFDFDRNSVYADRCRIIKKAGIAIWDVIGTCVRPGSLDASIDKSSIEANDFTGFFNKYRKIQHVFFNGATAAKTFKQYVVDVPENLIFTRLPSTSPAHASMSKQQKIDYWSDQLLPILKA